jgi:hypothetical protein
MKTLVVLAMSRSGHHAVINWIAKQAAGVVRHVNHAHIGWPARELVGTEEVEIINNGPGQLTIYSIEDFWLPHWNDFDFSHFPALEDSRVLIIARDPYNWIASSLEIGGDCAKLIEPFTNEMNFHGTRLEIYLKQLRCVMGEENPTGLDIYPINFNKWFESQVYRQEIARELNFEFSDQGLHQVSEFGGGSSFDSDKGARNGQTMGVLERWQKYRQDSRFLEIVNRKEVVSVAEGFFGYSLDFAESGVDERKSLSGKVRKLARYFKSPHTQQ